MDKVEFADPLLFLNLIGMHPFKTDTFSKTREIISISIFFLVIFSGLLELIFNSQGLETFARASDTMVPQCQVRSGQVRSGQMLINHCLAANWQNSSRGSLQEGNRSIAPGQRTILAFG
jgi:hypothetical protein